MDSFTTVSKLLAVNVAELTFFEDEAKFVQRLAWLFLHQNLDNFNIQSGRLRFPPSDAAYRRLRPNLAKLGSPVNADVPANGCLAANKVTKTSTKSTNKRKKTNFLFFDFKNDFNVLTSFPKY